MVSGLWRDGPASYLQSPERCIYPATLALPGLQQSLQWAGLCGQVSSFCHACLPGCHQPSPLPRRRPPCSSTSCPAAPVGSVIPLPTPPLLSSLSPATPPYPPLSGGHF